ncbi:hypothetical protein MIR68_007897 [Amoeboaphelidium protococcarum]|nr:hypothetical protein MIR68_007897 [Amoeboaphelidium protococcarum]
MQILSSALTAILLVALPIVRGDLKVNTEASATVGLSNINLLFSKSDRVSSYYLGGSRFNSTTNGAGAVLQRYNASNNALIWTVTLGGVNGTQSEFRNLNISSSLIYAVGRTNGNVDTSGVGGKQGGYDAFLAIIDQVNGTVYSVYQYGSAGDDAGDVVLANDQTVYGQYSGNNIEFNKLVVLGNSISFSQTNANPFNASVTAKSYFNYRANLGSSALIGSTDKKIYDQTVFGGMDVYVVSMTPGGTYLSGATFGTSGDDLVNDAMFDPVHANGTIFVVGSTTGTFPNQAANTGKQAFLMAVDQYGNKTSWTTQFGSSGNDSATAVYHNQARQKILVIGNSATSSWIARFDYNGNLEQKIDINSGVAIGFIPVLSTSAQTSGYVAVQYQAGQSSANAALITFSEDNVIVIVEQPSVVNIALIVGASLGGMIFCCGFVGGLIWYLQRLININKKKAGFSEIASPVSPGPSPFQASSDAKMLQA